MYGRNLTARQEEISCFSAYVWYDIFMIICGYEKFSMVDYDDKIACTIFTGGCNFRCPFCHNGALVIGDVAAQRIDEEEVIDYLIKRRGMVDAVCVSGGEPTLQPDLGDFLRKVRDLGYLTKLDTNGLRPDVVKNLIDNGLLDYIAMDIKNSPEKYHITTGVKDVDMEKIRQSVDIIMSSGIDYEFRTTMMDELHTAEDMRAIASWIEGAKRYYLQKYKDNEGCIEHGYNPVDLKTAKQYLALFEGKVSKLGLRGY